MTLDPGCACYNERPEPTVEQKVGVMTDVEADARREGAGFLWVAWTFLGNLFLTAWLNINFGVPSGVYMGLVITSVVVGGILLGRGKL